MKRERTLGFIAVFVGGLLVALTSVSADHFIAGGVIYSPTSDLSETSVQCQFLGVKSRLAPDEFVIPTTIQCTVVHKGEPISFRLFTSGTKLDPFTVKRPTEAEHIVTLTGKMRSQLILGVRSERRHFTEIAPFKAVGVDVEISGADPESFSLTIDYSASKDIGPLLSKALEGTGLVTCNADTCTLTVAGIVIDGEIESHTSGDE
jgi:hypothetical protein